MTVLDKMREEKAKNEERKLKKLKEKGVKFTLKGHEYELYYISDDYFKMCIDGLEITQLFGKGEAKEIIEKIFAGKYSKEVSK